MTFSAGIIASQALISHEKRMVNSVSRLMSALAREIDASWSPEPLAMIASALASWRSSMADLIFRFAEQAALLGVNHIYQAIGRKNTTIELVMMGVRYRLRVYSNQQASILEAHLRDRISRELASGKTVAQARKSARQILNNRVAIDRITRGIIHSATEQGLWNAANSLGVRVRKQWVSREDANVRPAHAAANGQVREIEEPFQVGGEPMMYPGDPSASRRNTANCRCTVNYSFG